MTPNTTATRTTETTKTVSAAHVRRLLRDAAFVLRMTRRVKDEILGDAARPSRPAPQSGDVTPAALGA